MITFAGLSHRSASLEVRERFSLPAADVPAALLRARQTLGPAVALATCHRFELYLSGVYTPEQVSRFLAQVYGECEEEIARHFRFTSGEPAVRHLFAVASGLDSVIIGESEILGQVRDAFNVASNEETDDAVLSKLFHGAIRVGRDARAQTDIGRHGLSVSSIATQQASVLGPPLKDASVLVVGTGDAGRRVAELLSGAGVRDIVVTNRTAERATVLAADLAGRAVPFESLPAQITASDIVITSTGAPRPVISTADVRNAMRERPDRPLVIVDIGMPRDVEPAVRALQGVTYRDLDDLQGISNQNRQLREAEVSAVEALVADATARFVEWYEQLEVIPTISALTERAEAVRQQELDKTLRRLDLTEEQRARLEALTRALVKQVLHDPISVLREHSDGEAAVDAARRLFRLDHTDEPRVRV